VKKWLPHKSTMADTIVFVGVKEQSSLYPLQEEFMAKT
jgi:hypothetical protein